MTHLNDNDINTKESIELGSLTSDSVTELLDRNPGLLVKYGIQIFGIILILLLSVCWLMKFPDKISTEATFVLQNSPKEIKAKVSGRIIHIYYQNNDLLKAGALIGSLECMAEPQQIISLSEYVDSLQVAIMNGKYTESNLERFHYDKLGEIQSVYQSFATALKIFQQHSIGGIVSRKRRLLYKEKERINTLDSALFQQKSIQTEDLNLVEQTFKANEKLRNEKVISEFEYRTEKSKLLNKQLAIPQINASIEQNQASLSGINKELTELDGQYVLQKNAFEEALNTLKSQLDDWKSKFLLIASIDGQLTYKNIIEENQQIKADQVICYIIPQNKEIYVTATIPQANFGKVKIGQKVILKLLSYPSEEYGYIEGKIGYLSNIADDSGYLAKIILPNGLKSNFQRDLLFKNGLLAQADIITQDKSMLDRIVQSIKKINQ